jgi:ATP-dependent Lon protease
MTNVSFKDDAIYYLIDTYSKEEGVRELKRKLEDIISKINLLTMADSSDCNLPRISIKFPLKITINLIRKILKK